MLYDKNMRKICAHCIHSKGLSAGHELCLLYGPVTPEYSCKRYEYDPLRRKPPKPAKLKKPDESAFKL